MSLLRTALLRAPRAMPFGAPVARSAVRMAATQSRNEILGLGDYPELPPIPYHYRHPTKYEDKQSRRNFGEPLPVDYDVLSMYGPDVQDAVPTSTAVYGLITAFASIFAVFYFISLFNIPSQRKAVPKQFPEEAFQLPALTKGLP